MPTSEKIDKVEELTAAMAGAKAIYLADFTGIDVAQVTGLRNQLREADVSYQVFKNRLAKRAAVAAGIEGLSEHFIGPTAIAYSTDDPITPAKILQDFAEKDAHFTIKTGIMDGWQDLVWGPGSSFGKIAIARRVARQGCGQHSESVVWVCRCFERLVAQFGWCSGCH